MITYFRLGCQILARRLLFNAQSLRHTNRSTLRADLALGLYNTVANPYRSYRRFQNRRGADPYTYGETPLPVIAQIARRCQLKASDICLDLGCGTGRVAFWLRNKMGCTVWAIDEVPSFIRRAQRIQHWVDLDRINFVQGDFTQNCPVWGATFVFIAGTCFSEETNQLLSQHLIELRPGSQVATISYPLTDYSAAFEVTSQFTGHFLWGKADVFCQKRK